MHFKAIPNKNNLVILRSHGKLTNILPRAVILLLCSSPSLSNGGGIVNAPVYCRFFIALQMSLYSGGWIALPKIYSGSYLFHNFICKTSFSSGHLCISGFGYSGIDILKTFSVQSLKANPSETLPALPDLYFDEALETHDRISDSL